MHNIKLTTIIFKCTTLSGNKSGTTLTCIKCTHTIVQPTLTYIFRTFLSFQTETPYPLNNNPHIETDIKMTLLQFHLSYFM